MVATGSLNMVNSNQTTGLMGTVVIAVAVVVNVNEVLQRLLSHMYLVFYLILNGYSAGNFRSTTGSVL